MENIKEPKTTGPLNRIRVIELGAFIAGPYCGQLLADLGADVIKVEPPNGGDPMRQWGLHKINNRSLWWPVIGRNKRSVSIDLRHTEGQILAKRLIQSADVLVENFRPGTLEKWQLDPEGLRREQPGLIVARLSGFGQTGPYRTRGGFGAVAEAMAGLRILSGYPDRPPTRMGLSLGDSLAGLFAAFGVVTSLYARETAVYMGKGQIVDVAITDSVLAILEAVISEFSATGKIRERTGPILPGIAPSNLYPTKDNSWVLIAANADGLFGRLALAMEQPGLASDPRFDTHDSRGRHQQELDELIARWSVKLSRDEILTLLTEHGVPGGPVYDAADITRDPHYRDRGSVVNVEIEELGALSMQGVMPKLTGTPGTIRWAGPRLGQHNEEVFREILGLTTDDIARLQMEGVV